MAFCVDEQCRSTVGHIKVYVEVLVDTFEYLHGLTGCEESCRVRVDGVSAVLLQMRGMTALIANQFDEWIVNNIGNGQMHVLSFGQVEGIAGLIGVHDMLVVLQSERVALRIVEREVDVVCEVGEDT